MFAHKMRLLTHMNGKKTIIHNTRVCIKRKLLAQMFHKKVFLHKARLCKKRKLLTKMYHKKVFIPKSRLGNKRKLLTKMYQKKMFIHKARLCKKHKLLTKMYHKKVEKSKYPTAITNYRDTLFNIRRDFFNGRNRNVVNFFRGVWFGVVLANFLFDEGLGFIVRFVSQLF